MKTVAFVQMKAISEFSTVITGGTPSTRNKNYWDGEIPWLNSGALNDGYVDTPSKLITLDGLNNSSAKLMPIDTVLIALTGATTGQVGYLTFEACANQSVTGILPSNEHHPRYLYYFLRSQRQRIKDDAFGGAQPHINQKYVKEFLVPLPPPVEQKRIAGILDAADALRANRRETLIQLDTLLQSIFLDMFGDPVTNPMGFPIKILGEFYASKRDGTKCGPFGSALKKDELVDSGVPVWNMDNIDPTGRMVLPFRMWITEEKYRQLEAYSVLDGDVIISRAGTVGKMCVANSGYAVSIISTNLIRVRFGVDLLPIYFVSLMNYCKGRVGRLKTGPDGAFTHMSTGVLDKLEFPCPPIDLQRRFAAIVESVEQQKARLRAHLAEMDTLFASLQQRAFNGELSA